MAVKSGVHSVDLMVAWTAVHLVVPLAAQWVDHWAVKTVGRSVAHSVDEMVAQ